MKRTQIKQYYWKKDIKYLIGVTGDGSVDCNGVYTVSKIKHVKESWFFASL